MSKHILDPVRILASSGNLLPEQVCLSKKTSPPLLTSQFEYLISKCDKKIILLNLFEGGKLGS